MRTLTIEYGERGIGRGPYDVVDEYGRRCDRLCFGEMLEQVVGLTKLGRAPYAMLTPDEWQARWARTRKAAESSDALVATPSALPDYFEDTAGTP